MENFGENLEYRMEDYEADFPYDDGDMFVLWDTNSNMVVGFQMVVTTDESNLWYTLIGPESDSYGTAPAPLSVTYFSGSQAIVQEAEIVEDTTLTDLVDLTQHNDDIIEDALEEALAEYGDGEVVLTRSPRKRPKAVFFHSSLQSNNRIDCYRWTSR